MALNMYWCYLSALLLSTAALNVTVDDQGADPNTGQRIAYSTGWNTGQSCSKCQIVPDETMAYMSTWSDATSDVDVITQAAAFTFSGAPSSFRVSLMAG